MKQNKVFKDPDGKFSMMMPSTWKLNSKNEAMKKNLYQFELPGSAVFQISYHTINERISQIIASNKIIQHDENLPNISFIENYDMGPSMEKYTWMALIDDHFFFAALFLDPKIIDRKNVGLELYDIRLALQHLVFYKQKIETKEFSEIVKKENEKDYSDIQYWRNSPDKYFQSIGSQKKYKAVMISPVKINALELYALLTSKISQQPNGLYDLFKIGKPLDNMIWWDFILECDKGFIQIWRTPFTLEANYYFDDEFDPEKFFLSNIEQYRIDVEAKIASFDRHTIYINHYQSYSECVEKLWSEIAKIDLTIPPSPKSHLNKGSELKDYTAAVELFGQNSIKHHALAKSLVLNAAFKVESFINLVIRIGSKAELRRYPEVLSKYLKQEFSYRVKNLRFYTQIFSKDIDMSSDIYRETKELMTLRNKYVHYEEDAMHNRLGEVYYDRDFPLHLVDKNRPAIDALIKTYHQPDMNVVRKAYETSRKFVAMVESLFVEDLKNDISFLIKQNPIGYNETKAIYSAVFTPVALDFFAGVEVPNEKAPTNDL